MLERHGQRIGERRRSNGHDVAHDVGADLPEQLPRDGPHGDACGRLARAGALQDVPDVVVPVFHDARQVGMAGSRARDQRPIDTGGCRPAVRFDGHRALPVLPILVRDQQRNRPAGGQAAAHTAQHLSAIGFDRHPAPASVAGLPAAQLVRHRIEVDRPAPPASLRGSQRAPDREIHLR